MITVIVIIIIVISILIIIAIAIVSFVVVATFTTYLQPPSSLHFYHHHHIRRISIIVTQAHAFVWLRGGRFPSQHLRGVFLQDLRGEALDTNHNLVWRNAERQ